MSTPMIVIISQEKKSNFVYIAALKKQLNHQLSPHHTVTVYKCKFATPLYVMYLRVQSANLGTTHLLIGIKENNTYVLNFQFKSGITFSLWTWELCGRGVGRTTQGNVGK